MNELAKEQIILVRQLVQVLDGIYKQQMTTNNILSDINDNLYRLRTGDKSL